MKKKKEISAWARALYLALDQGSDENKVIENLFLALNKKKYLIPSIIKKYVRIKEEESKISVSIAKDIDEDLKEKINKRIEGLEGRNKTVSYTIEEDLIGGFRIKTKDYLVKASIKDTLTKIKNNAYGYN